MDSGLDSQWMDSGVSLRVGNHVRREDYVCRYCILLVWNKVKLYLLSIVCTHAGSPGRHLCPILPLLGPELQVPDPLLQGEGRGWNAPVLETGKGRRWKCCWNSACAISF